MCMSVTGDKNVRLQQRHALGERSFLWSLAKQRRRKDGRRYKDDLREISVFLDLELVDSDEMGGSIVDSISRAVRS